MKRIMIFLVLAVALLLAGCGNKADTESKNKDKNDTEQATTKQSDTESKAKDGDPDGPLKLHVLKADQEAGATVENHPIYSGMQKFVNKYPDEGTKGDYSVTVVDATNPKDGKADLILLGINRLPAAIKDVSFNITVGDKSGHYVVKDHKVEIPAEAMGVLKPGYGHPILVPITDEELENLTKLDAQTRFVDLKDTKVSKAE
ncbi:hypothetical protein QR721_11625 [Aciduricibacillus chroicocephali]|uniref:Lipoprotein n=1 Tax=Aciduricibacillus chroicocephali TaxID=3054939 RepID=A0ABY9KTQ0_9BACI|nr:hypothetical protein QR721_11625 [Bacillaceae bacterium 44XB]